MDETLRPLVLTRWPHPALLSEVGGLNTHKACEQTARRYAAMPLFGVRTDELHILFLGSQDKAAAGGTNIQVLQL